MVGHRAQAGAALVTELHAYLASWRERPFEAGAADCAQFARGWVRLRTGRDVGAGVEYATIADGIAALRRQGIRDHVALVERALPEIHPAMAAAGDIAVVDAEDGPALAIVGGEHVYALGRDGLCVMPRSKAKRAFVCRR